VEVPLRADYEKFQTTNGHALLSCDEENVLLKNSLKYRISANTADAFVRERNNSEKQFILVILKGIHHYVASKAKLLLSLFHFTE